MPAQIGGQGRDLLLVVRHRDTAAGMHDLPDDLRHGVARRRVEPGPGLVEHEQTRPNEERLRQAHLLGAALGQLRQRHLQQRLEPEALRLPLHRLQGFGCQPAYPCLSQKVVAGTHRLCHREPLGSPPDHGRAVDDRARSRAQHPREHPQQRRLTGAVAPRHLHQRAGGQHQVNVLQHPGRPSPVPRAHADQIHRTSVPCRGSPPEHDGSPTADGALRLVVPLTRRRRGQCCIRGSLVGSAYLAGQPWATASGRSS